MSQRDGNRAQHISQQLASWNISPVIWVQVKKLVDAHFNLKTSVRSSASLVDIAKAYDLDERRLIALFERSRQLARGSLASGNVAEAWLQLSADQRKLFGRSAKQVQEYTDRILGDDADVMLRHRQKLDCLLADWAFSNFKALLRKKHVDATYFNMRSLTKALYTPDDITRRAFRTMGDAVFREHARVKVGLQDYIGSRGKVGGNVVYLTFDEEAERKNRELDEAEERADAEFVARLERIRNKSKLPSDTRPRMPKSTRPRMPKKD